jgi:hypothetical protein
LLGCIRAANEEFNRDADAVSNMREPQLAYRQVTDVRLIQIPVQQGAAPGNARGGDANESCGLFQQNWERLDFLLNSYIKDDAAYV